jgi:hypothetical protein
LARKLSTINRFPFVCFLRMRKLVIGNHNSGFVGLLFTGQFKVASLLTPVLQARFLQTSELPQNFEGDGRSLILRYSLRCQGPEDCNVGKEHHHVLEFLNPSKPSTTSRRRRETTTK